ncbi:phage holin family protein [Nesterenkonia suensis]
MRILLAIVLNACALGAAALLLPGIGVEGAGDEPGMTLLAYLFVGAVFGIINAVIKPILSFLAMPITCLTLGLFAVVINAAMLMLTAWVTSFFPLQFVVSSFFWDAILGAIIVALVSALLGRFLMAPTPRPA